MNGIGALEGVPLLQEKKQLKYWNIKELAQSYEQFCAARERILPSQNAQVFVYGEISLHDLNQLYSSVQVALNQFDLSVKTNQNILVSEELEHVIEEHRTARDNIQRTIHTSRHLLNVVRFQIQKELDVLSNDFPGNSNRCCLFGIPSCCRSTPRRSDELVTLLSFLNQMWTLDQHFKLIEQDFTTVCVLADNITKTYREYIHDKFKERKVILQESAVKDINEITSRVKSIEEAYLSRIHAKTKQEDEH